MMQAHKRKMLGECHACNYARMDKRDQIREWIELVLNELGWSADEWARKAGVAPSTLTRAKQGKFNLSNTSVEKLENVAGIPFGVPLSIAERNFIAMLRALPPHTQSDVLKMVRALVPPLGSEEIKVMDNENTQYVYIGPERRKLGLHEPPAVDRRCPNRYSITRK